MSEKDRIISDINNYIENQALKDTLRFITCGSVDDGKSTLNTPLLARSPKCSGKNRISCLFTRGCTFKDSMCQPKTKKSQFEDKYSRSKNLY